MKIAIQGVRGSFHHIVAENYFGSQIKLEECLSFAEMPDLVLNGKVDYAVMAVENSIAGAILPNYALIDEYELAIAGEFYLPIHQNLMALEGQKIEDIKEVYSHPMALLQCRRFFRKYPHIKLVEDKDTAEVAQRIHENKLKGVGAIAGKLAAEIYQLNVLASEIQTVKDNATRFVILEKTESKNSKLPSKASIKFGVEHKRGCLGEVLKQFSNNKVNLTKIQSLPIIDKPWEYEFFADLIFDDYNDYKNSMIDIRTKVKNCKVLGEYKQNR